MHLKSWNSSCNGTFLSEVLDYDAVFNHSLLGIHGNINKLACCCTDGAGSDRVSYGRNDLLYLEPQVPVVYVWNGGCVHQLCAVCLCPCGCWDCRL